MTSALEVDTAQFLLEVLAPAGIARVVTELPGKLVDALPVLQIVRAGGLDDGVILDAPTFVLHAFADAAPNGQKAAAAVLMRAHSALRAACGVVVTVDGSPAVMTRVRVLSGPSPAPYENPGVRHVVSTVQPRIKVA